MREAEIRIKVMVPDDWEDEEVDEHINNVIGAGVAEAAKVAADLRIPEIDRGAALSITQMQIEEVEVL